MTGESACLGVGWRRWLLGGTALLNLLDLSKELASEVNRFV